MKIDLLNSFIASIISLFIGSLSTVIGTIVLCYTFSIYLTNVAYIRIWRLFSVPIYIRDMQPNSALIMGYLLIFAGCFVATHYLKYHGNIITVLVIGVIGILLGLGVVREDFAQFAFIMFLLIIPVVILGYLSATHFVKTHQTVTQERETNMSYVRGVNLKLAAFQSYFHASNLAAIVFFDKSLLSQLSHAVPWLPVAGLLPFIMLIISLLLLIDRQSRKQTFVALALWFFCILGFVVQLFETLSHISFK